MNKKYRVIISGGGTAGHIFPAISIAEELSHVSNNLDILFVGAKGRMEMKKIPLLGYKIIGLWIDGIQRKWDVRNLIFPIKLFISFIHSFIIIINYRPNIVIGTGGFASGPIVFIAALLGIPTLIHEQNSFPGLSNRLLGRIVKKICVAYKNMELYFPSKKIVKTGNPIRKSLKKKIDKITSASYFNLKNGRTTILIMGGSLGATPINEVVKNNLDSLSACQIIWQTGDLNHKKYALLCSKFKNISVFKFIERMDLAYSLADIVISRAGAIAITEICYLEKTSLLIPSPYVSEDHQNKNAKHLEKESACLIVEEKDLKKEFSVQIQKLIINTNYRNKISKNAKRISTHNASINIIHEIKQMVPYIFNNG